MMLKKLSLSYQVSESREHGHTEVKLVPEIMFLNSYSQIWKHHSSKV